MVLFYFPILLAVRVHRFHTMGELGKWESATLPPYSDAAAAPFRHSALRPKAGSGCLGSHSLVVMSSSLRWSDYHPVN